MTVIVVTDSVIYFLFKIPFVVCFYTMVDWSKVNPEYRFKNFLKE